jgi:hypothetical protein
MASKEITSSDNNVFLKCPEDWESWDLQFQGQAVSKRLWDQILGIKAFLTEPIAPDISSFQRQGTTRPATRSQSTVDNEEIGSHMSISFANLPPESQKAYQFVYNVYLEEGKRYEAQLTSIDKLKEWTRKTVIPNYQQTCCRPTETITQWYEKLKEHVAISEYEAETEAREKYRRSIKPVNKTKDILNWITTWEQTMATAQQKNLSVATNPSEWFADFLTAVRLVMPNWVQSYRIMKISEVRNKTLTYRTLANDFREAVRLVLVTGNPTKVAKGSFGPVFADPDDQCAGVDASKQGDEVTQVSSKDGGRKGKRKQPEGSPSDKTVCRACGQIHHYQRCYYLFTEKAPPWFHERSEVRQSVNQALKDDPTLAEEVKRLKKKMEKKSDKNSQDD